MINLKDKNIIVTGASGGIGNSIVKKLNEAGANILASGTISGPEEGSFGSMLEISWKGTKPVKMPDGSERKFIQDGDSVIFNGRAKNKDFNIGFGELISKVLPPK